MRFQDHYSESKEAVRLRTMRLHDDPAIARYDEAKRKKRAAKRKSAAYFKACLRKPGKSGDKSIAFHMSKGRDAGDIAIRMNIPVSYVVTAMERIKIEQSNPTQSEETSR